MPEKNSPHRAKAKAMIAAMRDKGTRRMFFDAMRAEAGSPKRKTAARTMRIISKASGAKDGQGGSVTEQLGLNRTASGSLSVTSGPVYSQQSSPSAVPGAGSSGLNVGSAPSAGAMFPDPTLPTQQKSPFSGYPGSTGGPVPTLPTSASPTVRMPISVAPSLDSIRKNPLSDPKSSAPSAGSDYLDASGRQRQAGLVIPPPSQAPAPAGPQQTVTVNQLYQKYFKRNATPEEATEWIHKSRGELDSFLRKEQVKYGLAPASASEERTARYGPSSQSEADAYFPKALAEAGGDISMAIIKTKEYTGLPPSKSVYDAAKKVTAPAGATDGTTETADVPSPDSSIEELYGADDFTRMANDAIAGNGAQLTEFYESLLKSNPDAAARIRPIYDAVMSGQSAAGLVFGARSGDPEILGAFGLTPEVLAQMPFDLLAGPKLDALRTMAKSQSGMDIAEAQLNDRLISHQNAKAYFQDYIRSKDVLLGKSTRLLRELDDQWAATDTSDPRVQARFDRQRNFLKGIQTGTRMRYTDLLNRSMEQEQNDYDRYKLRFDAKKEEAENLFADLRDQSATSWESTVPLITDTITELHDSLTRIKDGTVMADQIDLYKTINDLTQSLDPESDANKLQKLEVEEAGYKTDKAKWEAIEAENKAKGLDSGSKPIATSTFHSNVGYKEGKDDEPASLSLKTPSEIWKMDNSKVKDYAALVSSVIGATDGNFVKSADPYLTASADVSGIPPEMAGEAGAAYQEGVLSGIRTSIENHINDNADTFAKAAAKLNKGKYKSAEELKKAYPGLSEDVLDYLWDAYAASGTVPEDAAGLSEAVYQAVTGVSGE